MIRHTAALDAVVVNDIAEASFVHGMGPRFAV
jgi:hypothetical protein